MSVTASSGSPRVSPQLYDTLPLSSVRQAEQQDRFPDNGELDTLITFFQSGRSRVEAAARITANADAIVARAANRIFVGGTPLSYLDGPLVDRSPGAQGEVLATDQQAFASSIETYVQGNEGGGFFGRILGGFQEAADVRVVIPSGFTPINVSRYGNDNMRKSLRDLGWFLRYVGYAVVAGDPSILRVNTRGLRDVLEKGCSLPATNLALQEMRAAASALFDADSEARSLVISCFNVLLEELAVATPSTRQRLGSPQQQGLQLPAIYALAAEGAQRFVMKPGLSGSEKAEIIRAAYRQVFQRDIGKAYSQAPASVEASQVVQGQISMREFVRALGRSKEYRQQFYSRFSNTRAVELAFRHFLGRGVSSIEEFRRYFAIVSAQGLNGLVDSMVNSMEYARVFGEETVPFLRDLGEEAQESAGWGSNRKLFRFSAPFDGSPQYLPLYASYRQPLADQHAYGGGNDPLALSYGAIFPSATASVRTRPAPFGYRTRRLMVGNGLELSGQINSADFRSARPRSVGPRVVRLQQIATGGNSVPTRGGKPSVRTTEASTQAVIRAVYTQVLGNSGYEGEQLSSAEARLENGDLSLRDFIRAVARSKAFQRRYWNGLYITKAIEVMHRRLLGRPTFGRWEIDAYFDTAARHGFYGLVDALIDSQEYSEAFGDDTVPFERFITPFDLNARRVPSFRSPLDLSKIQQTEALQGGRRPEVERGDQMNTPGSLTVRNLTPAPDVTFSWRADVSGEDRSADVSPRKPSSFGPTSLRQPGPGRSFKREAGGFNFNVPSRVVGEAAASSSAAAMTRLLKGTQPEALGKNTQRNVPLTLVEGASESELQDVIQAVYRQLLNRVPFEAERLIDAESQLRYGTIKVVDFVALVAASPLYQDSLHGLAPLRAATAVHLNVLGRAPRPNEISEFLIKRAQSGQAEATAAVVESEAYLNNFGASTVPYMIGLNTQPGVPLQSLNRTAALAKGNAGITPPRKGAI